MAVRKAKKAAKRPPKSKEGSPKTTPSKTTPLAGLRDQVALERSALAQAEEELRRCEKSYRAATQEVTKAERNVERHENKLVQLKAKLQKAIQAEAAKKPTLKTKKGEKSPAPVTVKPARKYSDEEE